MRPQGWNDGMEWKNGEVFTDLSEFWEIRKMGKSRGVRIYPPPEFTYITPVGGATVVIYKVFFSSKSAKSGFLGVFGGFSGVFGDFLGSEVW